MNVKKLAMSTVFIALIICVANTVSVAGSPSIVVKCTITNDTEYYADVKLIMHANGSSYNVNLYPHQTFAIPNEIDVYCPRGLQGKITYGIFSADIGIALADIPYGISANDHTFDYGMGIAF